MTSLDQLEALSREADQRPDDPDVWIRMADALLEHGSIEPARYMLERARDCGPATAGQWRQLGELAFRVGDPDAAQEALQAAAVLDGQSGTSASQKDPVTAEESLSLPFEDLVASVDQDLYLDPGGSGPRTPENSAHVLSAEEASDAIGFTGDLALFPLPDMLEFLAQQRSSGILQIQSAGRSGAVHMASGQLVDVSYPNRPTLLSMLANKHRISAASLSKIPAAALTDEYALQEALVDLQLVEAAVVQEAVHTRIESGIVCLLDWKEGHAEFHTGLPEHQRTEGVDARFVLLSALKRLDEEQRFTRMS